EAEAVLAARHAHGHPVAGAQHREAPHGAPDQVEHALRRVRRHFLYLSGALSGMKNGGRGMRPPRTSTRAGRWSASARGKPPSPQIAITGRSGCATLAPSAVGYSKPRLPEYDEFRYVRGRNTGQNGRE